MYYFHLVDFPPVLADGAGSLTGAINLRSSFEHEPSRSTWGVQLGLGICLPFKVMTQKKTDEVPEDHSSKKPNDL